MEQKVTAFRKAVAKPKWWHIALITIGVSILGALSATKPDGKGNSIYTEELIQAPWAPPGWVFGPAWTINNFFLLLALQCLIAGRRNGRNKTLLWIQGLIWVIYFSFGYVYFRRQSPVLAAVWTVTDAVLAITSILIARKENRRLALYYLPLTIWTSYASTVALYQAYNNDDPLLGG